MKSTQVMRNDSQRLKLPEVEGQSLENPIGEEGIDSQPTHSNEAVENWHISVTIITKEGFILNWADPHRRVLRRSFQPEQDPEAT
jgi:hypothetical protein